MSTFPQPFISSTSHWQATNRGPGSLWGLNADAPIPESADLVIIGGGLAGCALAYFLTRPGAEGEGKRIVLLEAKDIGSGATGRNGGHIGPATSEAWASLMALYPDGPGLSREEATRVIQAERDNLDLAESIIKKERLNVDFWRGNLCETHDTLAETLIRKAEYDAWLKAREELGLQGNGDTRFVEGEEAKRISRFDKVTSVQIRPGASVHSHKLCSALAQIALDSTSSNFSIHSWTPVSSLKRTSGGLLVEMTKKRGLAASKVILCTNAHTANFFPEGEPLHTHIQPRLAQCSLITPPTTYSGSSALRHTYNMDDGYYLVQTPEGGFVLGGGFDILVDEGLARPEQREGVTDDSDVIPEWTDLLASYCKTHFSGWGPEGLGEGLTRVWTGILTHVKDIVPLVGPVPGREGLFIAAGFNGHGMSRIFSTARALAAQLQTGQWDDALLPRSFECTTERLERVRKLEEETGIDAHNSTLERESRLSAARARAMAMARATAASFPSGTGEKGLPVEFIKEKQAEPEQEKKGWTCVVG